MKPSEVDPFSLSINQVREVLALLLKKIELGVFASNETGELMLLPLDSPELKEPDGE